MNDPTQDFTEQGAAFQKIWLESMSRLMQTAFTFPPNSAPPELLREIRSGILKALAATWNEFLRSPQFQQGMKQWLDDALAFRKASNDFMAKVRKEMQVPSRDDIDSILLAVRHVETRVLDRLEELAKRVDALEGHNGQAGTPPHGVKAGVAAPPAPKGARPRNGKHNRPAKVT